MILCFVEVGNFWISWLGGFKGKGTRDLIWLKVVPIIGKILMSRAHGRPLKNFKAFLYIFNYYFKKLSGTGKNYAYCKCE